MEPHITISLDILSVSDLQKLMENNEGYIDGDSRTVHVFVKTKKV